MLNNQDIRFLIWRSEVRILSGSPMFSIGYVVFASLKMCRGYHMGTRLIAPFNDACMLTHGATYVLVFR